MDQARSLGASMGRMPQGLVSSPLPHYDTVEFFNLFGDGLRDALDPRTRDA